MPSKRLVILTTILPMLVGLGDEARAADRISAPIFTSGVGGYHTYRIPSLIVSRKGTLLAFCEGRKTGRGDHGDIDLLLRRSLDGGKTWLPVQLVHEEGGAEPVTIGNPCPVVDRETGTIWLPFCRNNDDVFVTSSDDDGQSWATPRKITAEVKGPDWVWYATGPGVGIQLARGDRRGRLVIPCDHSRMIDGKRVMFAHVFFSDDHGRTWKVGGTTDRHTDECQVAELPSGELLLNIRNYWGRDGSRPDRGKMRAVARSVDGGETWSELQFDAALIEPMCQASLIAVPDSKRPGKVVLLFSNPASRDARRNLTVRASFDDGRTWNAGATICEGSSAYSCLAALPDGRIGLLYERDDYKHLWFTDLTAEEAAQ